MHPDINFDDYVDPVKPLPGNSPFAQLITGSREKKDIKERLESITLIIFNYDRCVEHFILHSLRKIYYELTWGDISELAGSINIYHPYGVVGTLQSPMLDTTEGVEFGAELRPKQLLEVSQKIKTFSEGTDPELSDIVAIREHMRIADRLVFLGFGFDQFNMRFLIPGQDVKDTITSVVKCFATGINISESDREGIEEQINGFYNRHRQIILNWAGGTCAELFPEYWRSLPF